MNRSIVAVLALVAGLAAGPAPAQDVERSITKVAGDLYRFQNNFHVSVFLVTPDGVVVTDPINADAARWLKAEIDRRFGKPIRYLVLSHDHPDHSSGGEVFAEAGAIVVAHENARATIVGERRPTATPDITFSDRMTLRLGGKTVRLIYPGRSHSDNLIAMYFPDERAMFTVDFISVKRMAYKDLGDAYFPDWIDAIAEIESYDFDILVPGHGPVGTKADAAEHREYLQALYDEVLAAARAGKTLERMKAELLFEDFDHFDQYEAWRELNIEGMYRQVSMHRRGN